jgi:hypothetical protein
MTTIGTVTRKKATEKKAMAKKAMEVAVPVRRRLALSLALPLAHSAQPRLLSQ